VIGVEFFDVETAEDAGRFFKGGGKDGGEEGFGFFAVEVAAGEFFGGFWIRSWASLYVSTIADEFFQVGIRAADGERRGSALCFCSGVSSSRPNANCQEQAKRCSQKEAKP
jgi:hypothetical protein